MKAQFYAVSSQFYSEVNTILFRGIYGTILFFIGDSGTCALPAHTVTSVP